PSGGVEPPHPKWARAPTVPNNKLKYIEFVRIGSPESQNTPAVVPWGRGLMVAQALPERTLKGTRSVPCAGKRSYLAEASALTFANTTQLLRQRRPAQALAGLARNRLGAEALERHDVDARRAAARRKEGEQASVGAAGGVRVG